MINTAKHEVRKEGKVVGKREGKIEGISIGEIKKEKQMIINMNQTGVKI
jgi:hypothetical protein